MTPAVRCRRNSLSFDIQQQLREQTKKLALGLNVIGLMNVQFAIQNGVVYVLEVNPRASRTAPFVSKATGRPIAKIGALVMAGKSLAELGATKEIVPAFYSVKEAVFPFAKFPESDPILGPEMKSTGEVMGTGRTFGEAYAKSQAGCRHGAATQRQRAGQRARARQVGRGRNGAQAGRAGFPHGRHRWNRQGHRGRGHCLPPSEQGARGGVRTSST